MIVELEGRKHAINLDNVAYAEIGTDYVNLCFTYTGEWTEDGAREHSLSLRGNDRNNFLERITKQHD